MRDRPRKKKRIVRNNTNMLCESRSKSYHHHIIKSDFQLNGKSLQFSCLFWIYHKISAVIHVFSSCHLEETPCQWIDFANSYYLIQTNWRKFPGEISFEVWSLTLTRHLFNIFKKRKKSSHFLQRRAVCKENKNAE